MLQTSNFVRGLATKSTNLQMTKCPLSGRGQGHVTHSRISHPLKMSLEQLKLESSNFVPLHRLCQMLAFGRLIVPKRGMARVT